MIIIYKFRLNQKGKVPNIHLPPPRHLQVEAVPLSVKSLTDWHVAMKMTVKQQVLVEVRTVQCRPWLLAQMLHLKTAICSHYIQNKWPKITNPLA